MGLVCRFNDVQVDAVSPQITAAHEHDDFGWALAGELVGFPEADALLGAHGAVVELEMNITDVGVFLVPDLAIGAGGEHLIGR